MKENHTLSVDSSLKRTVPWFVFAMVTGLPARASQCANTSRYQPVKLAKSCTVITKRMTMAARVK